MAGFQPMSSLLAAGTNSVRALLIRRFLTLNTSGRVTTVNWLSVCSTKSGSMSELMGSILPIRMAIRHQCSKGVVHLFQLRFYELKEKVETRISRIRNFVAGPKKGILGTMREALNNSFDSIRRIQVHFLCELLCNRVLHLSN